jgi:hypothetical protein
MKIHLLTIKFRNMTQQKTAWFVQYKDNREIIVAKRIICYLIPFTTTTKFFKRQHEQRTQYFRDYEKSKRSRQFLKEWKQNRPWLVDTESETGMVC